MVNVFATMVFLHYSKAEYKIIIEVHILFYGRYFKMVNMDKIVLILHVKFQNNFLTTYNVKIINYNYVSLPIIN